MSFDCACAPFRIFAVPPALRSPIRHTLDMLPATRLNSAGKLDDPTVTVCGVSATELSSVTLGSWTAKVETERGPVSRSAPWNEPVPLKSATSGAAGTPDGD